VADIAALLVTEADRLSRRLGHEASGTAEPGSPSSQSHQSSQSNSRTRRAGKAGAA